MAAQAEFVLATRGVVGNCEVEHSRGCCDRAPPIDEAVGEIGIACPANVLAGKLRRAGEAAPLPGRLVLELPHIGLVTVLEDQPVADSCLVETAAAWWLMGWMGVPERRFPPDHDLRGCLINSG